MNKKMTMQDIANMSGVAKSTVSRYFNGGYVKDKTREKIKEVIEENNYQPNAFAQSLKAKQSKIIGVIAPCLDSTVSSRIMMAIDEYLRDKGYTSLIINTNHNEQLELENIENLWRMNVDGIILIATQISEKHHEIIQHIGIPTVVVGQVYADGISIVNDDYEAGIKVGQYALKMGHRDIVYMSVSECDAAVGRDRKYGVLEGCKKQAKVQVLEGDFSFQNAYEQIKELLAIRTFDLLICATDMMALGSLKAIQEHHLQVPQDISLIGFGGYEVSSLITPKLTTVHFDNVKAGFLAAETIVKMLNSLPVSKRQIIAYEFLEGYSCQNKIVK